MNRTIVGFAVLLCFACERAPTMIETHDPRIIVHSMLVAGEDSVRVFVARIDTRGSDPAESPLIPIVNAHVRIVHDADTATLVARSHCVNELNSSPQYSSEWNDGCYGGAIAGGVRSGERYELIVVADGARARGEAVVPLTPVVHSPAPGITMEYSRPSKPGQATSVLVHWSGTTADQRVDLSLRPIRLECPASIMRPDVRFGEHWIALVAQDTATIAAFDVHCADDTQSVFPAALLLTAYDANYTRYLLTPDQSATLRKGDAAFGLTEGLGVFTAVASVAVPVTLVRR